MLVCRKRIARAVVCFRVCARSVAVVVWVGFVICVVVCVWSGLSACALAT